MDCLLHPPKVVRFKHLIVGGKIFFRVFNFVRFIVFIVLNLAGVTKANKVWNRVAGKLLDTYPVANIEIIETVAL